MTVINTNVGALTSRTYALKANDAMEQSMERLSSGLRINSAADDAAGLAVANKMESQLRGMNMAVRNSQDGISLVQTAEAGMSEISNMVIRMRELAVQMNNGIYTDADRTNAQLEVRALIAEIDKIATNSAFNQVKVLDGTYNKEIRAGNTNPETIQVNIDRMNSDSLGSAILSPTSKSTARTTDVTNVTNTGNYASLTATEATKVTITGTTHFGTEFKTFVNANQGGTFTLSGTDSVDFAYTASSTPGAVGTIDSTIAQAWVNGGDNVRDLTLTYSQGGNTVTQDIKLTIAQNNSPATIRTASSSLTVNESNALSINAGGGSSSAASSNNMLSAQLKAFVDADRTSGALPQNSNSYTGPAGYSLTGTDAGDFSIDQNGSITASLDHENPADSDTDNSYSFNVVYTNSSGDKFTEAVTLAVTDQNERVHTISGVPVGGILEASGNGVTEVRVGDVFSVAINNGTTNRTITHTATADDANFTMAELVTALQADHDGGTDLGATFSVSGNNLVVTFDDFVGAASATVGALTINRLDATIGTGGTATTSGVTAVSGEQHEVKLTGVGTALVGLNTSAGPATGDRFEITVGGTTLTTTADIAGGNTAATVMTNLVTALNTLATAAGLAGTFSKAANDDDLHFTYTANGASSAVTSQLGVKLSGESSFGQTESALGTASVENAGVTAVTGVAEVNTVTGVGATLRAVVKAGDTFSIGDGTNTIQATIGTDIAASTSFSMANLATALNARVTAMESATPGSAGNFDDGSFTANGNDLLFTYNVAGAQTSKTLTGVTFADAAISAGTSNVTNTGTATNATNAISVAATSTAGSSSTQMAASNASGANVVNASKATITLKEAKTVSMGDAARSASFVTFVTANAGGTYSVGGADAKYFTVNAKTGEVTNIGNMDFDTDTSHKFDLIYTATSGAKFTEAFTLNLTNDATDDGSYVRDIDMSSQQGANDAIEILDFAINQISASQSKLGAVQNRLQHNIDNLSMASMVTETAKGRITDADYARETSELSKQQILGQAATSMLAQANQSKQGVLALLQ